MLTVRDIMQPRVVTVDVGATARDLARILADEQISGAPVVDGSGALVGVVSATDLVRLAAEDTEVRLVSSALREPRSEGASDPEDDDYTGPDPYGFFLPEDTPFSEGALLADVPESRLDATGVEDIMTPVSFTVSPGDPVEELCAFLVRGRIHRAVVVENGDLVGIVTSADVLRAVAEGRLAA